MTVLTHGLSAWRVGDALRKALGEAKVDKIAIDVANRVWVQQGKKLEGEFTTLLADRFGAAAGSVDFAGATGAVLFAGVVTDPR